MLMSCHMGKPIYVKGPLPVGPVRMPIDSRSSYTVREDHPQLTRPVRRLHIEPTTHPSSRSSLQRPYLTLSRKYRSSSSRALLTSYLRSPFSAFPHPTPHTTSDTPENRVRHAIDHATSLQLPSVATRPHAKVAALTRRGSCQGRRATRDPPLLNICSSRSVVCQFN